MQRGAGSAVSVAGEAIQGARVPLSPGGSRLLDVIAAAGGATTPVPETFVRLSRDGVTATVPLAVLVADPAQNIFARPGDVLILSRVPQTLSVFGAAGKNALITFDTERLSLAEALAKAGGLLDQRADPSAIFVMRYEPAELVHALGQPVAARAPAGVVADRLPARPVRREILPAREALPGAGQGHHLCRGGESGSDHPRPAELVADHRAGHEGCGLPSVRRC